MSYRLLLIFLLCIGAVGAICFITSTVQIIQAVKPVTDYPVRMRFSGANGVVRTCYIESDTAVNYGKIIAKRNYSGLSISKLLVPQSKINQLRKVTFYSYHNEVQLAATAGDSSAGTLRLCLDTLSYQVDSFLFLILGYIFLLVFSAESYKRIFGKIPDETEVTETVNNTLLGKIYIYTIIIPLILVVIV